MLMTIPQTVFNIRNFGIVFLSLLWASFSSTYAQHNGQPLPRVNGESNQMVNLFTGRLSANVPLANISGRGDVGTSLNVLNRGTDWSVVETQKRYDPTNGQLRSIHYAAQPTWSRNAWSSSYSDYSPMALSFQAAKGLSGVVWSASGPMSSYLVLMTSDGNKVNFRDSLRDGEPTELNPSQHNGPIVQCGVVYGIHWPNSPPPPPPPNPPSYCLRGKVFHSTDGSGMTFVSDYDVYDTHSSDPNDPWGTVHYGIHFDGSNGLNRFLDGNLYLPNGTRYRIKSGKPIELKDRNGNVTKFNYVGPPYGGEPINCNNDTDYLASCRLSKITDSIGREIVINYGAVSEQVEYFDTIAYKGFGGAERQIKIYYDKMAHVMFPGETVQHPLIMSVDVLTGVVSSGPSNNSNGEFNPTVIARIALPNGQEYQYKYNAFGEIARIKTPTGAYTDYTYGSLPNPRMCGPLVETKRTESNGLTWIRRPGTSYEIPDAIVRRVTEARLFNDIGILQNKTTYSDIGSERPMTVVTKDPNNVTLKATKHYYLEIPCSDFYKFTYLKYFDDWRENREYKTEIYADETSTSPLRINETIWAQRAPIAWLDNHPLADAANASNDPRVVEIRETLETGQVTKKTFLHDQYNNVTDTYEYDYGNGQAGQLIRRSHTDYLTDSNYTSHTGSHIRRLPILSWISSDVNGNNKTSLTQIEYDNYGVNELVSRSNVSGHDSINYGIENVRRGNATKVTSFSNAQTQTGAISNQTQYDILGNIVKIIDPKGFVSTIDYSDRFGSPDAEARLNSPPSQLNGQNAFAFATSTTNPAGHKGYTQFDYFTGSIVDAEDLNENVNTTFYEDLLDRPTRVINANNRSLRSQTTTIYDDINRRVTVTSDLHAFNDNLSKGESFYDSLGRTTETRNYDVGGFTVVTKPEYDAMGRIIKTSVPYRPYLNEQPVWTTTTYDSLGRAVKVKTPDNADVITNFYGNVTTVIDQAGKKRRTMTNAAGQTVRVDEPNSANELGEIATPIQPTYYTYNTEGNLVKVEQGQQNRFFLYDSLGRLIRVRQPEQNTNSSLSISDPITGNSQWSIGSTYDANNNVIITTDSKGVVITHTYDNLNRLTTRSYSDGTPTVTNQYDDSTIPFGKGQLTKSTSTVSTTEYTNFNALGKVLSHRQITDGQIYTTAYAYNLNGALIEETYPSGRVVKNTIDNDGRLAGVTTKASGQNHFHLSASHFTYAASGAVSSVRLGNGLWESAQFNSRLQITQIGLGSSQGATNLWKLNYDYGEIDTNGNLDVNKNNGSTARQTTNFTGLSHAFVQTYQYDSLNRLIQAKEVNGTSQTFSQNFGYDRFGNRTSFIQMLDSQQTNQTPSVDPATNRFTTGQGFEYDFNGNLVTDNQGRQFTFNGDNKQTQVTDSASNTVGLYYYDGSGARVKKISASEATIFVYNAVGKLVAEYSTQIAPEASISYLTNDTLGSPRLITDNSGDVISRRDFMPFGEELYAGTTNRTEANKYSISGIDNVRKRFTGYEKDAETGLDFAEARYYDNRFGRFTAVDPLLASGQSADPQTFNRYVYVANNPINSTDPTGLWSDSQWSSIGAGFFTPALNGFSSSTAISPTDFVNRDTGDVTNIPDGIDQVLAADTSQIQRAVQLFNEDRFQYNAIVSALSSSDAFNLHLTSAEFYKLANAVYAESSGGTAESAGIVDVLENRAAKSGTTLMDQVSAAPGFRVNGVNSNRYSTEKGPAADQKRLNIHKGIAEGILRSDSTNGAYFWDGLDFNKNARGNNSGWQLRHQSGYFFTSPSHDLYKQGNHYSKKFGYYYESTAAIGSTTFSRRYNYQGGSNWR